MKKRKITKAHITHISFVPKGANGQDFLIVKAADEAAPPNLLHEAPILKLDADKRLVTGVVYAPDVVDSQGEFMEADAIEKAAHEFMADHRNMDEKHSFETNADVSVVESYVAKADTEIAGQTIAKGTWLITAKVNDNALWSAVQKGEYRGFSMGGSGQREEIEDELEKSERGLLSVLKDYFTGSKGAVQKDQANLMDFATLQVQNDIGDSVYSLREALGNILGSDAENKREMLSRQLDAYKSYLLGRYDSAGQSAVSKAFSASVEKAGKSISAANAVKIKAAYASLGQLISGLEQDPQGEESEDEVKKEELKEVMKEALTPLEERLSKLEKGEEPEGKTPETLEGTLTKEELTAIVKEAVEPLEERLSKMEQARGQSKQAAGGIAKEEFQPFVGIEI